MININKIIYIFANLKETFISHNHPVVSHLSPWDSNIGLLYFNPGKFFLNLQQKKFQSDVTYEEQDKNTDEPNNTDKKAK